MAGKFFDERVKAGNVRNKALDDILEVLQETENSKKFGEFKKQVLLKLATNLLPRLNVVAGEGESPLQVLVKFINGDENNRDTS